MANGFRRDERPIEMHTFDECVGAQHFDPVALRFDYGCIVADADDDPVGGGRQALLNARDEVALLDVADGG